MESIALADDPGAELLQAECRAQTHATAPLDDGARAAHGYACDAESGLGRPCHAEACHVDAVAREIADARRTAAVDSLPHERELGNAERLIARVEEAIRRAHVLTEDD